MALSINYNGDLCWRGLYMYSMQMKKCLLTHYWCESGFDWAVHC